MRTGLMNNYAAVGMEDRNNVSIVGHLCWYSCTAKLIARSLLRDYIGLSGVSDRFMPNDIRIPDAFRRATSAIAGKKQIKMGNDTVSYLVKEVVSTREMVQRNVVREVINSRKTNKLRYDTEEAIITLDKENNNTIHTSIYNTEVEPLVEKAIELFETFKTTHDDAAIRAMLKNIINSMSPVMVKISGGVYFIPIKYEEELMAFCDLANQISPEEAHMVPMIKTSSNMDLIRKSTVKQLNESFQKLKNTYDNEQASAADITIAVESCNLSFKVIEDYKELLQGDLSTVEQSLGSMQRMLRDLSSRKKNHTAKDDSRQLRFLELD
ncbi:DNA-binding protein H-NS [Paenibacillus sp. PastF-3]|uniref:DUF6744 family protein n=1 Tax=unclassified Paenibacillus TaxID=185978 RepID=UPI000BA058AA|nr:MULTISPECIES: DUF6744 family protein [unclassified Paenibacillus]MDH6372820.1 DNA-binding protein H-NS [Paenibacillus sp. PastF-3]OZQ97395.1 hypothetical protein CA598_06265 [Paenibacillus sp. VTT E-133291]